MDEPTDDHRTERQQVAPADRLRRILRRGAALAEERDAVEAALRVLNLDPDSPDLGHPLTDLYRALMSPQSSGLAYLRPGHRSSLRQAIYLLERNMDSRTLFRALASATAERLRSMARRREAFPDNYEDLELALRAMRIDPTDPDVSDPLVELYMDLAALSAPGSLRYLTFGERTAVLGAAKALDDLASA